MIAWDTAHAGRVRPLLEAAVAHHWVPFDGRVATLDPADPVDGRSWTCRSGHDLRAQAHRPARREVRSCARCVDSLRRWPGGRLRIAAATRPVGRMLREFDLALSTGSAEKSATLLREIESIGGISHENVAFLRFRRLSRLGREADLLADGSLPSLVYAEPPFLVREAVLGAWARVRILPCSRTTGVDAALAAVQQSDPDIAMLVDSAMLRTDRCRRRCRLRAGGALRVRDAELASAFAQGRVWPRTTAALIAAGGRRPAGDVRSPDLESEPEPEAERLSRNLSRPSPSRNPSPVRPRGWSGSPRLARCRRIARRRRSCRYLGPAWAVDDELAAAIDALAGLAEDNLLNGVAALPGDRRSRACSRGDGDSVDLAVPLCRSDSTRRTWRHCARCSRSLCGAARASDVLRGLLGDIRSYANHWVSVFNAVRVIDIADTVACGPAATRSGQFRLRPAWAR